MLYRNLNEFSKVISRNKRLMCLDFGERKFGIAFSDPSNLIAIPYEVYYRQNMRKDIGTLYQTFIDNNAEAIIMGLPLDMNSEENELCQKVVAFAQKIIKKYHLNIYLHDERFSTSSAIFALKEANISRKDSLFLEDKIAAALILQHVLDMMK